MACATAAILASALPVASPASIVVEVSALANLTYQLDCVSEVAIACGGRDAFHALWNDRFGVATARDPRIARWRMLRETVRHASQPENDGRRSHEPADEVRIAGTLARSVDDYRERIAALLDEDTARELAGLLSEFEAAFGAWWRSTAQPKLESSVAELRATLDTPSIRDEIRFVDAFYGVGPPAVPLVVQALYRPRPMQGPMTAQFIGAAAVVEVTANDAVEARAPVVVHEYVHFAFARIDAARRATLRAHVLRAAGARGTFAWQIADEAFATALGNGRVGRALLGGRRWYEHLDTDGSLDDDGVIDRAAKRVLPLVDDAYDFGRRISDPGMAQRYVELLGREWRTAGASPVAGHPADHSYRSSVQRPRHTRTYSPSTYQPASPRAGTTTPSNTR